MSPIEALIEVTFELLDGGKHQAGFGVARVIRSSMKCSSPAVGDRILAPIPADGAGTCEIGVRRCIQFPTSLSSEAAMHLPKLALAMAVCDGAELELGDAAVYTSGAQHEALVATIAQWRTGRDVIRVDLHDGAIGCPAGVQSIDASDPQSAIDAIQRATRGAPGFAAIVLSSKSEALDIVLESMPLWGRLVIASKSTDPATIDFYNNIHRKGVKVVSLPASAAYMFDAEKKSAAMSFAERAVRILLRKEMAAACVFELA